MINVCILGNGYEKKLLAQYKEKMYKVFFSCANPDSRRDRGTGITPDSSKMKVLLCELNYVDLYMQGNRLYPGRTV